MKKQDILDLMNSDKPVLLNFYTTNCTKHKFIKINLKEIKKKQPDLLFHSINVDIKRQPALVEDLELEGFPVVVLFNSGKEKWRKAGDVSEPELEEVIRRHN